MSFLTVLLRPLAYVSVPVFILRSIAQSSPFARYYIRVVLYYSTLGLVSVWGVIVAIGMSLAGRRFDINWVVARSFYLLASKIVDIKFVVEGEEHLDIKPAILVGNHQSVVDILYLGRIFPKHASIMAKKELQWAPFLGMFMSLSGAVFVDRGNNAEAVRSLQAAGDYMKQNETSLWLFPEGTRSMRENHDMLPFKKGAFHAAVQAGVPVIPVVCENYWRLYRKGVFESGELKIRVLPPIPTAGLESSDVSQLAIQTREKMVAVLREISIPASSDTPPPSSKPVASMLSTPPSQISVEATPELGSERQLPSPEGSIASSRIEGSENGMETEEDEGMVLVGRP